MSFDIRFIHHIDAVVIAKGIEFRVIRIVTCADCVDIAPLEQENVVEHVFISYRPSIYRVNIMPVDTLENNLLIIDVCCLSLDFNFSESVLSICRFYSLACPVLKFENYCIEKRS